jgi:ABC-type oligopeptide transport system substrate-binding subunit
MKNHKIVTCAAMFALALSCLLVGCAHEISSEKHSTVSSNGAVKTKEKTVTQSWDGTVTKTEDTKKTTPPPNP